MKKLVIILISFSIISCSFAPKYSRPTVDLPASDNKTTDNQTVDNKTDALINKKWWKNFENEKLNKLVKESLKNNDNLMLAYERINELEAAFRFARANLYPSINANASAGRFQTSDEASATGNGLLENDYSLSGSAIFEADLFGKLRNRSKAQKALLLAQKNYADTMKLRIISDTISTYFEICSADLQINTLNNIIDNYKRSFNYRKKQYRNGLVSSLIVKQQEAQLNNSYMSLENITGSKKMLENSLSLLLGKEPKEMFNTQSISCTDLPDPLRLPAMLPSKIIEDRPDIVSAEENLKAANFEIGVAKAAYFPTISLTGTLGLESYEFSNFMQSSAEFWNIGGNLTTPIFDFGRIKANVEIANSRQKQALINYIYTVKNAFKEVHDAFIQLENIQNKIERQKTLIADYEEILNISIKQYENGMIDYINVIDARRNLERLYLDLISLNKEYLKQQVFLYKAMGII